MNRLLCLLMLSMSLCSPGCAMRSPADFQNAANGSRRAMEELQKSQAEIVQLRDQIAKKSETSPESNGPASMTQPAGRMVIYTGSLDIVADKVPDALSKAQKLAESVGGYMQALTLESITVRVPAAKFNEIFAAYEQLGVVTAKTVSAQDVTEQYRDMDLRLRNARDYMDKLSALLKQADNTAAAIELQREMAKVRLEIEQIEGQINRLKSQVEMATITVRFTAIAVAPSSVKTKLPFAWMDELGLVRLLHF